MPITPQMLREHIARRETETDEIFSCDRRQYAAAIAIIRAAIGQEWVATRLNPATGDRYVRREEAGHSAESFQHQDRVTELGEFLFNMQNVSGFESRVRKLRKSSLESALAELEGARFLHCNGTPYRFVEESQVKGSDFDVEATVGDVAVACEMKARMEGTTPTSKSVYKRLNRAREQLPRDAPGIIFMRIPRSWTSDPNCQAVLDDGVARLFRGTQRIAAVFVMWDNWGVAAPSGAIRLRMFHYWLNPRSRIDIAPLIREIGDTAQAYEQWWVDLWQIVCDESDRRHRALQAVSYRMQQWSRSPSQPLPRGLFASAIYFGSLQKLRELDPGVVHTVIQFRCPQFALFAHLSPDAGSVKVSVTASEIREFTVVRQGKEPDQPYLICIPYLVHDTELRLEGATALPPAERIRRSLALLNQGQSPEEIDDGDPMIAALRELIVAMRMAGDLPPDELQLSEVRAHYYHGDTPDPLFQVDYRGRRFTI